ncbi:MAG: recombination regulator RecX [Spirochaetaceae bacterium]|jgi:SOS response regulatory protein OraA/RecX|nr:recombination regulator RecX [Spirochaetaceae bacterium]
MFSKRGGVSSGKTRQSAMEYASGLIARAEQYSAGLALKLQKKGYGKAEIHAVVEALSETGMLDDMRYSRLWLESRIKRKAASPRELIYALCGKGINRSTAAAALKDALTGGEEISACEMSLLKRFSEKNGYDGESYDGGLRQKFRHEGFSADVLERYFDE